MATVEMSFTPLPAHVRTARLVATAVARRSGVDEALLDEVRLAVGEACSRAVEAHQEFCPGEPVRVALTGSGGRFEVVVTDQVAAANGTPARRSRPGCKASRAVTVRPGLPDRRRQCPPSWASRSSRGSPTMSKSPAQRPASLSG
jgi:anti-sigma regulatory factor (Ser/Thr protein kinase)